MHMNVTGADAFKCKKKHLNLTGLITLITDMLLTYVLQDNIIASKQTGGIKPKKVYGLPLPWFANFLFHPAQVGSLFAG